MISRFGKITPLMAWQLYFFIPELSTHIAVKCRTLFTNRHAKEAPTPLKSRTRKWSQPLRRQTLELVKTRERGSNPPEVEDAKMEPTPPKADARIGRLPPPPSTVHPLRPTPVVPTTTNPRGKRKISLPLSPADPSIHNAADATAQQQAPCLLDAHNRRLSIHNAADATAQQQAPCLLDAHNRRLSKRVTGNNRLLLMPARPIKPAGYTAEHRGAVITSTDGLFGYYLRRNERNTPVRKSRGINVN
ncbi:hypothetical protein QE152_g5798 [Popillia japonica]|uniref:Uncharacterized protein n=1 Tax=Popillia japonica TaxID=7064 RepID=A0AAW1MJN7_POPJA